MKKNENINGRRVGAVKTEPTTATTAADTSAGALATTPHDGFALFAEFSSIQVERCAVHEFLQTIPHKWTPEDIDRFGYRVGRMALALQLAIVHGVHPDLGELRLFPVPLMEWVYSSMADGKRWPLLTDAQALDDRSRGQRLELRKLERAFAALGEITERADDVEVLTAANQVREFLKAETEKLQGDLVA